MILLVDVLSIYGLFYCDVGVGFVFVMLYEIVDLGYDLCFCSFSVFDSFFFFLTWWYGLCEVLSFLLLCSVCLFSFFLGLFSGYVFCSGW